MATVDALDVTPDLRIPFDELRFTFARSPGPGGQNVNKVNTRAELRFDVRSSPSLSQEQRHRLLGGLASSLTQAGVLIVRSSRFRSQKRNQEDCLAKLGALVAKQLRPPPPKRRPTRAGRAANARRIEGKRRHSQRKSLRRPPA